MAKGEKLKNLKNSLRGLQSSISEKVHRLTLWTERGAARHAKMLETDQAWEVFERLEDCYFSRPAAPAVNEPQQYQFNGRMVLTTDNGVLADSRVLQPDEMIGTVETFFHLTRRAGYFIVYENDLTALMHR